MRSIKAFALTLLASALLVGCSDEQSSFRIDNVPGRCTISGKIVYNQGTRFEDGKFVYDYKPLANSEVFVTVYNDSYADALEGKSVFKTTTDENGSYSIEIPAPDKNIMATVTTPDFLTDRSYVTVVNNKVETKTETVVMRCNETVDNIHSNGICLASFTCSVCNVDMNYNGYTQYARLDGVLGQNSEYKTDAKAIYNDDLELIGYDNATVTPVFVPAKNADLIIDVDYNNGMSFTLNVTTDSNGKYTLQVPVKNFPANFSYRITAPTYDGQFTHYEAVEKEITSPSGRSITYWDLEAHTLTGYYAQSFCTSDYYANYPVSAEVVSHEFKAMVFRPLNNGQETYNYSTGYFSESDSWLEDYLKSLEENLSK